LALPEGRFADATADFEEASRRDPHNAEWQYALAFAHLGLGQQEQAQAAMEEALARTELHEQMYAALQNLELLERAQPDLPDFEAVRKRIQDRKALLDRLAEEECSAGG
jgi:thioredoxin-like negative regulator of GroEL